MRTVFWRGTFADLVCRRGIESVTLVWQEVYKHEQPAHRIIISVSMDNSEAKQILRLCYILNSTSNRQAEINSWVIEHPPGTRATRVQFLAGAPGQPLSSTVLVQSPWLNDFFSWSPGWQPKNEHFKCQKGRYKYEIFCFVISVPRHGKD